MPETRHFLVYRLQPQCEGPVEILLSERSVKRLRERIKELTPRAGGKSLREVIRRVNAYYTGWMGHFCVCTEGVEQEVRRVDAHLRRRLRAIVLKHWRRKRTIVHRLIRLGVKVKTAWERVYKGKKSLWALSHDYVADRGMQNAYFKERGLRTLHERFKELWADVPVPRQLMLPLGI